MGGGGGWGEELPVRRSNNIVEALLINLGNFGQIQNYKYVALDLFMITSCTCTLKSSL